MIEPQVWWMHVVDHADERTRAVSISCVYNLQGYISTKTVGQFAEIRAKGLPVVLVTGTRTPTFMRRLPHLPIADVYVSENGVVEHVVNSAY